MKRISVVFAVIIAAIPSLYGQVTFVPKAGISYAHVSLSHDFVYDEEEYKSKFGLILGVAVEIPLINERLTLQPELLLHQKGFTYKYTDVDYQDKYSYTLNYVEVPILMKAAYRKFYGEIGPSVGIGLWGKYKGTTTSKGQQTSNEGKIKFGKEPDNASVDDHYIDNALDVGLQLGVGVKLAIIIIDLRYAIGLTNLYDDFGSYKNLRSKNGSLQLTIGLPVGHRK